ncbi:MAG: hypothetical protein HY854_17070 [Burkholderiales bacterium]|nr:hypothetical protein [Burkholderiales bacterium]
MSETLQILEKVNAFYSASFTQLITYTGALLALVGVLLPLFIALQQARQAKRDQEQLTREIREQLAEASLALKASIGVEVEKTDKRVAELVATAKAEMATELKRVEAFGSGSIFHVQARGYRDAGVIGHAFSNTCTSAKWYVRAKDENNLIAVMRVMKDALAVADATDLEVAERELAGEYERFLEAVKQLNGTGRYTGELREIRQLYDAAKARQKPSRKATDVEPRSVIAAKHGSPGG